MRHAIRSAVALFIIALVLRTFVAAGLISPVIVHGSSMAPWARGAGVSLVCPRCAGVLRLGHDQAPKAGSLDCPHCTSGRLSTNDGEASPPDSLLIQRAFLQPRRWEPVVFRSPNDAQTFAVKRVLGLPGEEVVLSEGDLWVDGVRAAKPFDAQLAVRRLEHEEHASLRRWSPLSPAWVWESDGWSAAAEHNKQATLAYEHDILDDQPSNVGLSRAFNPQPDLMIECRIKASADARFTISVCGAHATIDLENARLSLDFPSQGQSSACALGSAPTALLLTTFDKQPVIALDGAPLLGLPQQCGLPQAGPRITVLRGRLWVHGLRIWKDIFYQPRPLAHGSPGDQPWHMGQGEFFVVGDNQALSLDSRNWSAAPGVPRRLILGRAAKGSPR